MKLYLCRHGQTEANRDGMMQGWIDTPLTEAGIQQARRVGTALRHANCRPTGGVYSSDLGRAYRTAHLIYDEIAPFDVMFYGVKCIRDLREMNYGKYNYVPRETVLADAGGNYYDTSYVFPGGESFLDLQRRVIGVIQQLAQHDDTNVVVAHSGCIRAINDYFGQYPISDGKNRRISHEYIGVYDISTDGKCLAYEEITV